MCRLCDFMRALERLDPQEISKFLHAQQEAIRLLHHLDRKLDKIMSAQQDLDALVADINTRVGELTTATDAIKAEITQLQGQGVDVSGLQAAVALLDPAVDGVSALAPAAPPAPPA